MVKTGSRNLVILGIFTLFVCSLFVVNCSENLSVVSEEHHYHKDMAEYVRDTSKVPVTYQVEDTVEDIKTSLHKAIEKINKNYDIDEYELITVVLIAEQKLFLIQNYNVVKIYAVSTSQYGVGNEAGSYMTPTGTHRIRSKIGDGASIGTIFKGKANTGRVAKISQSNEDLTDEDYVTTRILTLEGLENGINKGSKTKNGRSILVDSYKRAIYIHGTPEEGLIGQEASHGCIRMINEEVIELFDMLEVGTFVEIVE